MAQVIRARIRVRSIRSRIVLNIAVEVHTAEIRPEKESHLIYKLYNKQKVSISICYMLLPSKITTMGHLPSIICIMKAEALAGIIQAQPLLAFLQWGF